MMAKFWIGSPEELGTLNKESKGWASFLLWEGEEKSVRGSQERGNEEESAAAYVELMEFFHIIEARELDLYFLKEVMTCYILI